MQTKCKLTNKRTNRDNWGHPVLGSRQWKGNEETEKETQIGQIRKFLCLWAKGLVLFIRLGVIFVCLLWQFILAKVNQKQQR